MVIDKTLAESVQTGPDAKNYAEQNPIRTCGKNQGEPIRIIALDLDGTLLNSDKQLSPRNERALRLAAEKGIEIVPTTGRFHAAMPQVIRDLPFVNYAITINGAQVYDLRNRRVIARAEIPYELAEEIMMYLDTLPCVYDCFQGNAAWMAAEKKAQAAEFVTNPHYLKMIRELRHPVSDLKYFVRTRRRGVQKIQLFIKDPDARGELISLLSARFPQTAVSTSLENNVEINWNMAQKGLALKQLADCLGIPMAQTMAFGDGLNDFSMIRDAGIGVAMANADDAIKALADRVTRTNDEDGVAAMIETLCLGQ